MDMVEAAPLNMLTCNTVWGLVQGGPTPSPDHSPVLARLPPLLTSC